VVAGQAPEGEFDPERVSASRVARGLDVVRERLANDPTRVAFVHAGSDADSAYLGCDAAVVTADEAVVLVEQRRGSMPPPLSDRENGAVRVVDDPAGSVVAVVDELGAMSGQRGTTRTVLTPRSVRHDVALLLERAGYDLASTTALDEARAVKTSAERDALRTLGRATAAGFDTAADCLARADVVDGVLRTDEGAATTPLTETRLARTVAATLSRRGIETPDVRVQSAGDALGVDRPVVVECRPVAAGVRLRAAWTFVVDGDGGWERRAQLALDAAHRAAREKVATAVDGETVTAGEVTAEVRAEVTAYGFDTPGVAVHGIGQSARERPQGGDEIRPGQVLVVAASVTRADDETVEQRRRTDVVRHVETLRVGTSDGDERENENRNGNENDSEEGRVERLVSLPASLSPSRALESS
jgi:Xaa-Pro aminopeptidase